MKTGSNSNYTTGLRTESLGSKNFREPPGGGSGGGGDVETRISNLESEYRWLRGAFISAIIAGALMVWYFHDRNHSQIIKTKETISEFKAETIDRFGSVDLKLLSIESKLDGLDLKLQNMRHRTDDSFSGMHDKLDKLMTQNQK